MRIMRNSRSGSTPKANTVQDESVSNNAEKTGTRKLKQARLPFKVIAPSTTPAGSKTSTTADITEKDAETFKEYPSSECKKRKLSYNIDNDGATVDIKEDDNISKENFETLTAATKKKKILCVGNSGTTSEIVSLLDDDEDNDDGSNEDVANSSVSSVVGNNDLKTPKAAKRKGAGTPQTSSAQKDKNDSATILQIKLPLSGGKKKRRKSNLHQLPQKSSAGENSFNKFAQDLSSDDIEDIAVELNPLKRKKLNTEYDESNKLGSKLTFGQEQKIEVVALDSESERYEKAIGKSTRALTENDDVKSTKNPLEQCNNSTSTFEKSPSSKNSTVKSSENDDVKNIKIPESSDEDEKPTNYKDVEESVVTDNEADDETDNLGGKYVNILSDISENLKSKANNTKQSLNDGRNSSSSSKNLTPKQIKLMDQRRRTREEKERKLQEEKMKKQQEKEERELVKKREREEKEEQKRKEREEKEEQKRKDREEKERKRLAEIEAKNEEKRKKNEAKEEELRKKEEERKRKEQEKEDAELKKKKAAQAFTKFFVAKTPINVQLKNEDDSNTGDGTKLLAFRPFQIKGDMKLAPICRKNFTAEEKICLEDLMSCNKEADEKENNDEEIGRRSPLTISQLYLAELRSGNILPGKWRRPSTECKDDVILVEDELERVGQEILEDTPAYIREEMRVKFYKFHDNRRPPYYGTWRKKSIVVKPRRPFAQDMTFFDYEVDSDDEWEEEEPGESLEDGSDEDREKESEDDEYEVDNEWFVPHGHLSDEELQNEHEFGMDDDNTREAQKAKLQLLQQEFAQEMKKKTEKIKPRLIGCIWADINGNQPPECAKILWDTLGKKAMLFVDPPLINEPETDKSAEPNSPSGATTSNTDKVTDKLKPISLSDSMVKDLTRLIHGNNHAKNFLINEYIAYVEKTEESVKSGGLRKPLKSAVRDKIEEIAEWQVVDAAASNIQEMEKAADIVKKKKKVKRRLCWVVKQDMLDKMDLSSLELKNSWKYTLQPKSVKADKEVKADEITTTLISESILTSAEESAKRNHSEISKKTKFAEDLRTEKKASSLKISSADKSSTETKSNAPATPKERKRVPLLMSVARGQHISTPAKNKLISQFLQQKNKDSVKPSSTATSIRSDAVTSPSVEVDDIVILD